jgi:hypothetical membrane protein
MGYLADAALPSPALLKEPKGVTMKAAAVAGIVAPILFTILVVVQSVAQPDYSQVAQPVSALAAWPYGWVQNVNFLVTGALLIAFAVALHYGVEQRRHGWIALALLSASGLGVILVGLVPWRRVDGALVEPAWHGVGAIATFLGAGLGLMAMSRRMVTDPAWRRSAGYVLASGVAIVLLFVILAGFAIEDEMPLHPWAGLLQRIVLAIWLPCIVVLGSKLLRTTAARQD